MGSQSQGGNVEIPLVQIRTIAEGRCAGRLSQLRELDESYKDFPFKGAPWTGPGTIERVSGLDAIVEHQKALYVQALTRAAQTGQLPFMVDLRPHDVGIFVQNSFYVVRIDPVRFGTASGVPALGTYIQVHYAGTAKGEVSQFVLPVTAAGKIVCNLLYRYNLDTPVLECPGTVTRAGEDAANATDRLFKEKLGRAEAIQTFPLQALASERGAIGDRVQYVMALVGSQSRPATDPIYANLVEVEIGDLLRGLRLGWWEHPATGQIYSLIDDYMRNALLMAFESGCVARLARDYPDFAAWGIEMNRHLFSDWSAITSPDRRGNGPESSK